MNRRGFFRALASAPFLSVAAPTAGLFGASFAAGGHGVSMAHAAGLTSSELLRTLSPPPVINADNFRYLAPILEGFSRKLMERA